jgi:hypothetical protein
MVSPFVGCTGAADAATGNAGPCAGTRSARRPGPGIWPPGISNVMSAEKVAFITKCLELDVAALEGLLGQLDRMRMLLRSSRLAEIAYTAALLAPTRPPRSPVASSAASTGTRRAYVLQPSAMVCDWPCTPNPARATSRNLLQHACPAELDTCRQRPAPARPPNSRLPASTRRRSSHLPPQHAAATVAVRRVGAGGATGPACWSGKWNWPGVLERAVGWTAARRGGKLGQRR